MKILLFSEYFPPEYNAAASRVFEQAYYWQKRGHEVTVVTTQPNFPEGKLFPNYKNSMYYSEIMDNIRVIRVKTFITRNKGVFLRSIDYASYLLPGLIAGLLQKKPDIIIANCPTPFAGLVGIMTGRLRSIPCVLQVSDLWPASIVAVGAMRKNFAIKFLEKFELFLYHAAYKVIVLTAAFKQNLIGRGINADKIHVVLNGVDLNRFYPQPKNWQLAAQLKLNPNYFIVGYIGTFGMAHALENILHAAALIKKNTYIHFLFIGTGAEREKLCDIVKNLCLTNVTILLSQPKERIAEFWSLCDLALVHLKDNPVFNEVIPSKIFEAMGMGKPLLIAAPDGEATQLIKKEQIGLVVPPEDPNRLAETIIFASENQLIMEEMAKKSKLTAKKYSRESQADAILNIIEFKESSVISEI